jgi:hypothetical protein
VRVCVLPRLSRAKLIVPPFQACQAAPGRFITTSLGGRQPSEDVISESIVAELLRILVRELTDRIGDRPGRGLRRSAQQPQSCRLRIGGSALPCLRRTASRGAWHHTDVWRFCTASLVDTDVGGGQPPPSLRRRSPAPRSALGPEVQRLL